MIIRWFAGKHFLGQLRTALLAYHTFEPNALCFAYLCFVLLPWYFFVMMYALGHFLASPALSAAFFTEPKAAQPMIRQSETVHWCVISWHRFIVRAWCRVECCEELWDVVSRQQLLKVLCKHSSRSEVDVTFKPFKQLSRWVQQGKGAKACSTASKSDEKCTPGKAWKSKEPWQTLSELRKCSVWIHESCVSLLVLRIAAKKWRWKLSF